MTDRLKTVYPPKLRLRGGGGYKTKIYISYVDLANDNVYTKFGLNLSIHSQELCPDFKVVLFT